MEKAAKYLEMLFTKSTTFSCNNLLFAFFIYLSVYDHTTVEGLSKERIYSRNLCDNCSISQSQGEDVEVDCSSRGFFHVPECDIKNARKFLLHSNNIKIIHGLAFRYMNKLEVILLHENRINLIHVNAFNGLGRLKYLDLNTNQLSHISFNRYVFKDLTSLEKLKIYDNKFRYDKNLIFENSLSPLYNLKMLYVGAFDGLVFGSSFRNMSKLNYLEIRDHMHFTNQTFNGLKNTKLEYLNIEANVVEKNSFVYLKHLKGLDVSGFESILYILESLSSFENRTFDYLRLGRNVGSRSNRVFRSLNEKHFRYLGKICTEELDLSFDYLMDIENSAIAALNYKSCIKKLDLSENHLESSMFRLLPEFSNLEYLDICCENVPMRRKRNNYRPNGDGWYQILLQEHINKTNRLKLKNSVKHLKIPAVHNEQINMHRKRRSNLPISNHNKLTKRSETNGQFRHQTLIYHFIHQNFAKTIIRNTRAISTLQYANMLSIYICKTLNFINASHLNVSPVKGGIVKFVNGVNMKALDLAFTDFGCNFSLRGMPNLQMLNISHFSCDTLIPSMLQHFPNLKHFVAVSANLNEGFKDDQFGIFFKGLTKLEHINLAKNDLRRLHPDLFSDQITSLKTLILSENRFVTIPKNLLILKGLESLDFTYNNFTVFTPQDQEEIEALALNDINVKFHGNTFTCVCDYVDFVKWIVKMSDIIDLVSVLCMTDNGVRKDIQHLKASLTDFELRCSSKDWLIGSVCGLVTLTLVVILAVLAHRNRIFLDLFFQGIRWWLCPKKSVNTDYAYDTFIAASRSNHDASWVALKLIKYLEVELKLKTCFYEKDSPPGDSYGDWVCDAIRKSRKVIYVITTKYLESEWLIFELEQARMYMFDKYFENNIIILLKDDIPITKLPRIIRTLKPKTLFLQYPIDESPDDLVGFWKKIRKSFKNHIGLSQNDRLVDGGLNQVI